MPENPLPYESHLIFTAQKLFENELMDAKGGGTLRCQNNSFYQT
jgi:hypothetical protein